MNLLSSRTPFGGHKENSSLDIVRAIIISILIEDDNQIRTLLLMLRLA